MDQKAKAKKKIRRKVARAKPCPFCGRVPEFDIRCDDAPDRHGYFAHFAIRNPCCKATASGQTELFFTPAERGPCYHLWWRMVNRLVDDWNRRKDDTTARAEEQGHGAAGRGNA